MTLSPGLKVDYEQEGSDSASQERTCVPCRACLSLGCQTLTSQTPEAGVSPDWCFHIPLG